MSVCFSTILALACSVAATAAADVTGKVTLHGAPPNPDVQIRTIADRRCTHGANITTENWKVAADGGLADVIVTVKAPGFAAPAATKPLFDQQGCRYVPHVLAVTSGTTVTFRNSDQTLHNIHCIEYHGRSEAGRDLFNIGQPMQGATSDRKFEQPGVFQIRCDVHPWMLGWIFVTDNKLAAITGSEGAFNFSAKLPDGEYSAEAWHSGFDKTLAQNFAVKNGNGVVNFEFEAAHGK